MKFNHKSILKRLTQKFNTSLKKEFYININKYSKTEKTILPDTTFVRLNSENLARFLNYSDPHFIHENDIVQLTIDNQLVEMPVYQLEQFINKDFADLAYEKYINDQNLNIIVSVVDDAHTQEFKKKLSSIVQDYCAIAQNAVQEILKRPVNEDVIYEVVCSKYQSAAVFDGSYCVASGNCWDFHAGCHGLVKYKNIKLGNWDGYSNLSTILSLGLKKTIIKVKVDEFGYELLVNNDYSKNEYKHFKNDLQSVFYDMNVKKKKEKDALKKTKLSKKEMINVLKEEFGGDFYEDHESEAPNGIFFDSSRFYSYTDGIDQEFEDFIKRYKGWFVEILNPEAIVILPIA